MVPHSKRPARRLVLLAVASVPLALAAGCQKQCLDDGFAWQQDPSCLAQLSQGDTEDPSTTDGLTEATLTDSGPTDSGGDGQSYCKDGDGDGHGDASMCTDVPEGGEPPPGTVPNDDDCDDTSAATFPGAAQNESETACMKDTDDDGWGDVDPPDGGDPDHPVVPGTDCDDADADTFVGAAPNDDPAACMTDADDDDYGDVDPPGTGDPDHPVVPGTDCDDGDVGVWDSCSTCVDGDGDGCYVDCEVPPPGCPGGGGSALDCDDADPNTFPGAAPQDDADACMTDADGDDYGDDTPTSPDAVPGTDCDDGDDAAHPGAAPLDDPAACMRDGDDDDHGDAHPSNPAVTPGNDCNDMHDQINPTDSVLITAPITSGEISEVDVETGSVTPIAKLDVGDFNPWIPTSLAVNPVDRSIVAALAFQPRLVSMNYCGGGAPTAMAMAHNKSLCGLAFDASGALYGIDGQLDQFLTFNADGSLASVKPLTFEAKTLNVGECGMTWDCHAQRMLVSDSSSGGIYTVDTADGTTTRLADLPTESFGAGLAYEPVTREALSCQGTTFLSIALDGSNGFTPLPDLEKPADDLEFAPACN